MIVELLFFFLNVLFFFELFESKLFMVETTICRRLVFKKSYKKFYCPKCTVLSLLTHFRFRGVSHLKNCQKEPRKCQISFAHSSPM